MRAVPGVRVGTSSDDVASSRISTAGSARNARANATSCRCPAESRPPRRWTSVSYPSGSAAMNSCAPIARAAATTSASAASGPPEPDVVGDRTGEEVVLLGDHHDRAAQVGVGHRRAGRRRRADRAGVPGRRTGPPAWRPSTCRRRSAPTSATICPAGIVSDSASRTGGRPGSRRSPRGTRSPRPRSAPAAASVRAGSGTAGRSSSTPAELLQRRGRRLERVVELAQLLHRLEEPAQVEQERGEHAERGLPAEHPPAAVRQSTTADRHVADHLDGRASTWRSAGTRAGWPCGSRR